MAISDWTTLLNHALDHTESLELLLFTVLTDDSINIFLRHVIKMIDQRVRIDDINCMMLFAIRYTRYAKRNSDTDKLIKVVLNYDSFFYKDTIEKAILTLGEGYLDRMDYEMGYNLMIAIVANTKSKENKLYAQMIAAYIEFESSHVIPVI